MQALIDLWLRRWRRTRAAPSIPALRPMTVVTGASKGLGLRLAIAFAAAGNPIMLVARHADALADAAREVERETGTAPITVAADLAVPDGPRAVDAALAARDAYCDILINNAGVGLSGEFCRQSHDAVLRLVDLNVRAATELLARYLPGMVERGRGGVVNVASVAGFMPGPQQAAYYASKAYLISLTEAVGYECRGQGVRICVIAPGAFDSDFHETMGADRAYYALSARLTSADNVARSAYRGYRLGRRIIVPGLHFRAISLLVRVVPHPLLLPILDWILRPRRR